MTEGEEFAQRKSSPGDRALRVHRLVLISYVFVSPDLIF